MGVRDPYQAYGLSHLINSYLQAMSAAPPTHPSVTGTEPTFPPDQAQAGQAPPVGLEPPPPPPPEPSDEEKTAAWRQRMQEARDKKDPKGAQARADKKATQAWINKMRAAKMGQKAVGAELAKPMPQPMVPPGQVFAPQPVINPQTGIEGPSQDDLDFIQRRREWIRQQGIGAVGRGLEE